MDLIKKEFKVSKSWLLLLLISLIFAVGIFMSSHSAEIIGISFFQNIVFSYAIFMLVYVSVIDSSYHDIRNKSDMIFNSFPIDRGYIVRSKYLMIFIYIIIYSIPMGLANKIIAPLVYGDGSQLQILKSLVVIGPINLIFYSIYYPLYFKSEDGLMAFNQVFRVLIIIAPSLIAKFAEGLPMAKIIEILARLGNQQLGLIAIILSLVIYYISLQISKKIYSGKEFF